MSHKQFSIYDELGSGGNVSIIVTKYRSFYVRVNDKKNCPSSAFGSVFIAQKNAGRDNGTFYALKAINIMRVLSKEKLHGKPLLNIEREVKIKFILFSFVFICLYFFFQYFHERFASIQFSRCWKQSESYRQQLDFITHFAKANGYSL